jgi:hypothetical protein
MIADETSGRLRFSKLSLTAEDEKPGRAAVADVMPVNVSAKLRTVERRIVADFRITSVT